jgi:acetyltransferase-like isoleucine patch superfamily enzyme
VKTKFIISLILLFLPWPIRRLMLNIVFGYKIAPSARIGISIIIPRYLILRDGATIGSLNICKGLDEVILEEKASIGNMNWISGYSALDTTIPFFKNQENRRSTLRIGKHSAITNRHLIDCSDSFIIMNYSTLAGSRSQVLTHSIDLKNNIQSTHPVFIGSFCFLGTNCVLLAGARVPDYCVVGAMSLVNKEFTEDHSLYGGVPARLIKKLSDLKYFDRLNGIVY